MSTPARASDRRMSSPKVRPPGLYAVQSLVSDRVPTHSRRANGLTDHLERPGLAIEAGRDFDIVNPENDARFEQYWSGYHKLMNRKGVSPFLARTIVRSNSTVIAALMVAFGEADSLICGTIGQYLWHLRYVDQILANDSLHPIGALSLILNEAGNLFIGDTHVHTDHPPGIADT